LSREEALEAMKAGERLVNSEGELIHDAISFAVEKHYGQVRKGTDRPYITHPFEVMQILSENGCSERVRAAGMLHDVLEDTKTSAAEIKGVFGKDVLKLIAALSEDKTKTWKERKQATIDGLTNTNYDIKIVCLADKVSNLRSMAADKDSIGETLWDRFNAPKEEIEWYYRQVFENMLDMRHTKIYKEYSALLDEVFDE